MANVNTAITNKMLKAKCFKTALCDIYHIYLDWCSPEKT